ncbi:MAG TPA: type II secretion system F family protein [Pyrinomonadaceae bacterium]|jgi:tight adherence protein B|nr:type II secretion system F family protein [Pyrinomonadaceae bacterium]
MLISTVVFLFFLFLTYAVFLLTSRKADLRSMRLQKRVAEALSDFGSQEHDVQISRDDTIGGSPAVNRVLSSLDFIRKLDRMTRQSGVRITVSRLLAFCALAGVLAFFAAATMMNLLLAIVAAAFAALLPYLYVSILRKKRLLKINSQLPDTLDLLGRSLAVGHAFPEALNQVASEMPDPIATEFRIVFEEQKLGLSTKAALDGLSERVPLTDLRLCITAIHIQRETGGNLAEILEKVSQTIRERFKLMEDFRTLTTSSRGSAWILCILPFAIVFALTAINPDYMSLLLHDWRGHYVLALAVVLQILGMLTIKKILAIRV